MSTVAIVLPVVFGSVVFILVLAITAKAYENATRTERETANCSSKSSTSDGSMMVACLRSCLGLVKSQREPDPENKFTEEELIAEIKRLTESQQLTGTIHVDESQESFSTSEGGQTHLISNQTDATLPPYKP
ncbi:hypothetical protein G9P44_006090 [Scheffersomyces stipitis]|nr:hypothetical protein G9P44_006090 [Scheffersomyces stipitis]